MSIATTNQQLFMAERKYLSHFISDLLRTFSFLALFMLLLSWVISCGVLRFDRRWLMVCRWLLQRAHMQILFLWRPISWLAYDVRRMYTHNVHNSFRFIIHINSCFCAFLFLFCFMIPKAKAQTLETNRHQWTLKFWSISLWFLRAFARAFEYEKRMIRQWGEDE